VHKISKNFFSRIIGPLDDYRLDGYDVMDPASRRFGYDPLYMTDGFKFHYPLHDGNTWYAWREIV
jgi:hypothetical protein